MVTAVSDARVWKSGVLAAHRGRVNDLYLPLLIALTYYGGAKLGFALTFYPKPVSTLWAPNAILMAALLATPTHIWWRLLVAALAAHVAVELQAGVPLLMLASWFVSNLVEVLIGAVPTRHYLGYPLRFTSFRNVMLFLVFCVFLAPFLSSFLDAAFVTLNGWGASPYWAVWQHRLFSNTLAALLFVPPVLAWQDATLHAPRMPWPRLLEATALAASTVVVSLLVFGRAAPVQLAPVLFYAPLPLLVWAAVRFGQRGISTVLTFMALFAVWNAVRGLGPFVTASAEENRISIQLFFIVVGGTLLSMAALLDDRKRSAQIARRDREQLQLALEAAQMETWDWPFAETHRWLDATRRVLSGETSDAVIYFEGFESPIHPADLERVSRALGDSTRTGAPFRVEFRVVEPTGRIRWVVGRGKVLRDANGRPVRMTGLTADISYRKATESLITNENRILKMIGTGVPVDDTLLQVVKLIESELHGLIASIVCVDSDRRHLRHSAAPSLPYDFVRAIDGLEIGPDAGPAATAMQLQVPIVIPDIRKDDVAPRFVRLAVAHGLRACWATPMKSDQGQILGAIVVYYRDVHTPAESEIRLIEIATHLATIALERKQAEMRAHEQRQAIAHLGRVAMLGELAGAYAHELTQPLTAVLSNAQAAQRLLAMDPPDLEELREILADIIAADMRASNVIHGLRPMLTKGKAQLTALDVNLLMFEAQRLARADLEARDVHMITRPAADLPQVLGDRVQLQQVLLNLIVNAGDAMRGQPHPHRTICMSTYRSKQRDMVGIAITDQGPGIPANVMDRIFDPFLHQKRMDWDSDYLFAARLPLRIMVAYGPSTTLIKARHFISNCLHIDSVLQKASLKVRFHFVPRGVNF
jgi:integral membrane sensor domain MASE1/signal transduction histidine kinase